MSAAGQKRNLPLPNSKHTLSPILTPTEAKTTKDRALSLVVRIRDDGSISFDEPALLAGMSEHQVEQLVLKQLAIRSVRGDMSAAQAYLRHRRWQREMAKGKPTDRSEVTHRVVVVDNLGRAPVATIEATPIEEIAPGKAPEATVNPFERGRKLIAVSDARQDARRNLLSGNDDSAAESDNGDYVNSASSRDNPDNDE